MFQRLEQWTGCGRLVRGDLENAEDRVRCRLWLDEAGSDTALEVVDLLIEVDRQCSEPGYPGHSITISADNGRLGRVVAAIEESVPIVERNAGFIEACRLNAHAEPPLEQAPSQGILTSRRRWRQTRQSHLQSFEGSGAAILRGFAHIGPARSLLGIGLALDG